MHLLRDGRQRVSKRHGRVPQPASHRKTAGRVDATFAKQMRGGGTVWKPDVQGIPLRGPNIPLGPDRAEEPVSGKERDACDNEERPHSAIGNKSPIMPRKSGNAASPLSREAGKLWPTLAERWVAHQPRASL